MSDKYDFIDWFLAVDNRHLQGREGVFINMDIVLVHTHVRVHACVVGSGPYKPYMF